MTRPTAGLYLPPDRDTLARLQPALAEAGHLEVVPETLWIPGADRFVPNAFFRVAAALRESLGVPILAHGVGLSVGSTGDGDRQARWLERLADTHAALPFAWMTEHSGATVFAGENLTLPVAVPCTTHSRDLLRARLDELADLFGTAGVENSAIYALFDAPEVEPDFLADALGDRHALLLDLHNLVVLEHNHGFPAEAWLDRAPLHRVIEVHVAGGSGSEGLPVRRPFRLDSHDHRVPERVWELLDAVLPRLPALRALTLERLESTVEDQDVPGVVDDLGRLRDAAGRWAPSAPEGRAPAPPPTAGPADHEALDAVLAEVYRATDPAAALAARLAELPDGPLQAAARRALSDPDALHLTGLLVAQLRFSRLLQGSDPARRAFDADPAGFTRVFREFHRQVAPRAFDPVDEARAFARFTPGQGA